MSTAPTAATDPMDTGPGDFLSIGEIIDAVEEVARRLRRALERGELGVEAAESIGAKVRRWRVELHLDTVTREGAEQIAREAAAVLPATADSDEVADDRALAVRAALRRTDTWDWTAEAIDCALEDYEAIHRDWEETWDPWIGVRTADAPSRSKWSRAAVSDWIWRMTYAAAAGDTELEIGTLRDGAWLVAWAVLPDAAGVEPEEAETVVRDLLAMRRRAGRGWRWPMLLEGLERGGVLLQELHRGLEAAYPPGQWSSRAEAGAEDAEYRLYQELSEALAEVARAARHSSANVKALLRRLEEIEERFAEAWRWPERHPENARWRGEAWTATHPSE